MVTELSLTNPQLITKELGRDFLQGHAVIGQREMVLNWKRVDLNGY